MLLAGDSVFLESVARLDLEADAEETRELAETLLAPGHYADVDECAADDSYTAPLGSVLDRLPALELDRETFVDRICADIPPRPANVERIVTVNLGAETVDEDTAFELELGPNNCAAAPL